MVATKTNDIQVMIDPQIFNPAYIPYLDEQARVQIFFGGASSGKSYFVIGQRTVIDLMRGGRNYLICRAVGRTIRHSVFNQIERTIIDFGVRDLFTINKSEMTITCVNGYQIFFAGLDDVEKIKSITPLKGAITDVVIEEATECDRKTIKQLRKRQRGGDEETPKHITLLFNPILLDHWLFSEYFAPIGWDENDTEYRAPDGSLTILRTWFEHNLFLTEQDKQDLLNEDDKYYSDVYTWGKFGVLGNVIFTNWVIADLDDPQSEYYLPDAQRTNLRAGCDFGFADSPAAVPVTHYDKKKSTIYFYDEFYESETSDEELADEILRMIGKSTIRCDSAEPKSISKLRSLGVMATPAKKGADSVTFGLKWLQTQKMVIHKKCIHTQNEVRQAKWKEGPDGKLILRNGRPVPVDANNHLIDGTRYAYEDDMIVVEINTNATVTNYIRGKQEQEARPGFR